MIIIQILFSTFSTIFFFSNLIVFWSFKIQEAIMIFFPSLPFYPVMVLFFVVQCLKDAMTKITVDGWHYFSFFLSFFSCFSTVFNCFSLFRVFFLHLFKSFERLERDEDPFPCRFLRLSLSIHQHSLAPFSSHLHSQPQSPSPVCFTVSACLRITEERKQHGECLLTKIVKRKKIEQVSIN